MKKTYLFLCLLIGLSSCYKENTIIPALLDSKGKTANIAIFWIGATRPATTVTVDASVAVPCMVEYISEVDVKAFNIYTKVGTAAQTLYKTIPLASANVQYNATLRNQVATIEVPAPATKAATMTVVAEIVTSNDLLSNQKTVTIRTK